MIIQWPKRRHAQTQQNTKPELSDADADQASSNDDDQTCTNMEGAETGPNRSPPKIQTNGVERQIEPEETVHEGSVSSRTPKRPV